ncbi:hypothetical protein [Microbispora sitophila]|nr:hypothetical protein [Microbispora sitophila]
MSPIAARAQAGGDGLFPVRVTRPTGTVTQKFTDRAHRLAAEGAS